jgi:lipoprotein
MVRAVYVCLVFVALISCGSRVKNLEKVKENTLSEEKVKVDSVAKSTETAILETKTQSDTQYTLESKSEEFTYTFEPTEAYEEATNVVIKNYLGQLTEITLPKGVKTIITNRSKDVKSAGSTKEDTKQTENKTTEAKSEVKKDIKTKDKTSTDNKTNNVERHYDPVLTIVALLILFLILIYITRTLYKRFFKQYGG